MPCPSPGDLPDPGIELVSPASQADSLPAEPPGNAPTRPAVLKSVLSTEAGVRTALMGQGTPHPRDLAPHDSLPALRPTQALVLPPTPCHSSFKHSRIQSPWLPLSGKASSRAQDEGILILHGAWSLCPFLREDTWPTADGDRQHLNCRPAERDLHASTPAPEAASSAGSLSNPNAPGPPRP